MGGDRELKRVHKIILLAARWAPPNPPVTVSTWDTDHRAQAQREQEGGREEDPQLLSLLPGEPELNIWV